MSSLRDGIDQAVPGVVDPDVDALEMMQGEREHAVDIFGVPDVKDNAAVRSRKPMRTRAASARAASRDSMHNARALLGKHFGNRLADAHRSARDHDDFPFKFHARVVFSAARQVKVRVRRSAVAIPVVQSVHSVSLRHDSLGRRRNNGENRRLFGPASLVPARPCSASWHAVASAYFRAALQRNDRRVPGERSARLAWCARWTRALPTSAAPPKSSLSRKNIPTAASIWSRRARQRFEVLELNRERSFLRAEILFVPDEPVPASEADKARAIRAHLEILSLAGAVQDLSAADQEHFRFISPARCHSISISSRNCSPCDRRASAFMRSRLIWKAFFRICGAQRGRGKKPAATGTRSEKPCVFGLHLIFIGRPAAQAARKRARVSARIIGPVFFVGVPFMSSLPRTLGDLRRSIFSEERLRNAPRQR